MKKKDSSALADAFKKLSEAAAEIAEALNASDKKSDAVEAPAKATATETTAKPATKPAKVETSEAPASDISFEDIRTALAGKAGKGYRAEVKEILSKHNASCLSDLESRPEDFAEILKEAEAIGNE